MRGVHIPWLSFPRRRLAAVALAAATVLLVTAGCGGGDDATSDGPVTLIVDVFGQFGYDELYKQYKAEHPDVKIVERGTGIGLDEYSPEADPVARRRRGRRRRRRHRRGHCSSSSRPTRASS